MTANPPMQESRGPKGWLRGVILGLVATVLPAQTSVAAASAAPASGPGVARADIAASQFSSPTSIRAASLNPASTWDPVAISAPGGPAMVDSYGRVVTLHGVNVVYKRPPYELTVTPGSPWSFTSTDAARIADLGFDVVRLGILWEGLEPGAVGPNNPAVCSSGAPRGPQMLSLPIAKSYLQQVAQVVNLLGEFHVHTILDMHQDVYSQAFSGEGAPAWAVCTDGTPITVLPGRWSRNYANPALNIAVGHFFSNDVVGDLQGQFDRVWAIVASTFSANPWVVGYDPYNEPFSRVLTDAPGPSGEADVAATLECFYTGSADPGWTTAGTRLRCPASVPAVGVVPTIEAADPHHLVFLEPDIFSEHGAPDLVGPMPFGRLVLNFHAYCGHRSPITGDPSNAQRCARRVSAQILARQLERPKLTSTQQPGGPAWMMSEFGATRSTAVLDSVTDTARHLGLSWAYWSWKYYADPTGSSHEAVVQSNGSLGAQAAPLATPYAEAAAGTGVSESFDTATGAYRLRYTPRATVAAPTVVVVPPIGYPTGYCTQSVGGSIVSAPGAEHLILRNDPGASRVSLQVSRGACSSRSLLASV
jgi:endoglycosylceramidase